MKLRIGFARETEYEAAVRENHPGSLVPRKSVVQVRFPGKGISLAYYNDRFDLRVGDLVYVDGKLEGKPGRVTAVNYNFKIKLSEYKRVVSLVNTSVVGQFCFAGTHFVTFDRGAIPVSKVVTWFKPPVGENEEVVTGSDGSSFRLSNLEGMKIRPEIAERGHEYYMENRVIYISIDNGRGYAIVEGSEAYEVDFEYRDGEIGCLTCSCFCSYPCKHEFAAMLQLRETLERIQEHYRAEYEAAGYFAAIRRETLAAFAVEGKSAGSFTLN